MHLHQKIKSQQTKRLLLRGFKASDLQAYFEVLGDKAVARWLGKNSGFSLQETKQWLNGMLFWWEKHGYGPWAVVEKESNKIIGHCGLKFAEKFGEVELMYAIGKAYQNKGYASEASQFALHFAFKELEISKVIAYTLPHNKASRGVMEKIGMHYLKDVEHANLQHVLYGISSIA